MERESLAAQRRLFGDDDLKVAESLNSLGSVLICQGKFAEAETTLRESVATWLKSRVREDPAVASLLRNLGIAL